MKTRLPSLVVTLVMTVLLLSGVALAQGKVDINKADVKGLMSLKGIGEQKAKAIVKYRQMNGPFQSPGDLANVPGIGEKTVDNNKGMIVIGKGTPGKKGTPKPGKKTMTGAKDKAKKGMAEGKDKAKKGMAGSKDKAKKGMAAGKDKAKKGMTDTASKAKKAKPAKQ